MSDLFYWVTIVFPSTETVSGSATESLAGFEDHVSPFPLLSLSGVLGVAYDELSDG